MIINATGWIEGLIQISLMADTHSPDQIFISKLTEIILANLGNEKFGIKELMHLSGMSYFSLSRRVRSITGRTINQFIRETRLKRALEMLQHERVTATEAAYKVGFSSPEYFNKCFHEFFGYPPGTVKQKSSDSTSYVNPVQDREKNDSKRTGRRTIFLITSVILFIIILVYIGYYVFFKNISAETGKSIKHHEKSIAVLPFKNLSNTVENQYFMDGMMEEILTNLSKIHDLRVISRTSVEQFREGTRSASDIGKKLNVDYLVEGSGQKYGNKFVLRVQLIAVHTERHLWAESYDQEIMEASDIYKLESRIAQEIAAELKATITPEEKKLIEKTSTANLTAYDFYLRGIEEEEKNSFDEKNFVSHINKAENLYRKALENDPTFALAYTSLAGVYWAKQGLEGFFSENYLDSVPILCDIALSYDNQLPEAYLLKGQYYQTTGKPEQALKEYDKALKYNPNDWVAYLWKGGLYATYYNDYIKNVYYFKKAMSLHRNDLPYMLSNIIYPYLETGFIDQAKNYIEEFFRLDGDSVRYYYQLSEIETLTENYNNAVEYLKKAYAIDSNYISTSVLFVLGSNYMSLHQNEEALKYFKKCIERDTTMHVIFMSEYYVSIGWSFLQNGYREKAEYYFNKQIEISRKCIELGRSTQRLYEKYLDLALVYAVRGERGEAYKNLEVYNQKQEMSLYDVNEFRYSPLFDNLRNDTEFRKILRDVESKYQTVHEKMRKWLVEQGEL